MQRFVHIFAPLCSYSKMLGCIESLSDTLIPNNGAIEHQVLAANMWWIPVVWLLAIMSCPTAASLTSVYVYHQKHRLNMIRTLVISMKSTCLHEYHIGPYNKVLHPDKIVCTFHGGLLREDVMVSGTQQTQVSKTVSTFYKSPRSVLYFPATSSTNKNNYERIQHSYTYFDD